MKLHAINADFSVSQVENTEHPIPKRRVLYNNDGCGCMCLKRGSYNPGPVTKADMRAVADEITQSGSQVDTLLMCINAQVMFYPSKVGTMYGALLPADQRKKDWLVVNHEAFYGKGIDPYAIIIARAKERGLEALLSFRMNDDHGNEFLRTKFLNDHPQYRLGRGALDFSYDEVREYVFRLIEEAVQRYECDGIELDFQRFPNYFKSGTEDEKIAKISELVERVRQMLDEEGKKKGRRLMLAVRTSPTIGKSREIGLDPAGWDRKGLIDFLTVSRFLRNTEGALDIQGYKKAIPNIPIYGSIEFGMDPGRPITTDEYRSEARKLRADGVDGIYLFNFFCSREYGDKSFEPPFFLLNELGDPRTIKQ